MIIINPFVPKAPFLYLVKTSENIITFSDVFKGYRKGALGTNGLKLYLPLVQIIVLSNKIQQSNII